MKQKKFLSCASILAAALTAGAGSLPAQVGIPGGTGATGAAGQGANENPSGSAGMAASSDDIRKLQQALRDKGLDPGPINGVMGPKTQEAVRAFQQRQGLNATGRLDAQTQSALGMAPSGSSPQSGFHTPGSGGPSAGTSVEPAVPRDPSIKPGEPLPPTSPSPGARSPGSSPGSSGASGGGSAGGAGGR
jgi:peptidoglycan hydrolase-like protein with peptidoglycan-binding domain